MRKFVFMLLLTGIFSARAQPQKFTINAVFLTEPQATKIYIHLVKMLDQTSVVNQKNVVQGKFSFSGTVEEPQQCILSWTEKLPEDRSKYFSFILDKGTITVTVAGELNTASVSGSKANTDFQTYFDLQKKLLPQFEQFDKEAETASRYAKNMDSLRSVLQPRLLLLQKKVIEEQYRYINLHPDAFISLLLIPELAETSQNYNLADTLFQSLDPEIKKTSSGKEIYNRIITEQKVSVGAVAPDFTMRDINSKPVKLSSLKGKYVLIDFWASWCGPCRMENPNVVNTYNTFKNKGFTVLGISLDRVKADWLKAVNDDGLTWTQLSDLKYKDNAVAKLYGIRIIPRNFLLDPTGKIIARDLRGTELAERLHLLLDAAGK